MRSPPTASPQPPVSDGQAISAAAVVKNLPPARGGGQYGSYGRGDRGYHRDRRENRERLASRSSTANDDTGSVDGDGNGRRSNTNYPDTHQLFVGNLPHSVTQQEVKVSCHSSYKNTLIAITVMELRHRKRVLLRV